MSVRALSYVWPLPISPTEKLLMLALADHTNDEDHTCWPSLGHLEKKTGLSRTSVWRTIDRLVELGLVLRIPDTGRTSTVYRLTLNETLNQVHSEPRCTVNLGSPRNIARCTVNLPQVQGETHVGAQCTSNHKEPSINHQLTVKGTGDYPEDFEKAWQSYPKRLGGNPKKDALKAWNARRKEGVKIEDLIAGVTRYHRHLESIGKVGTEFVMQASRFFGPSKPYAEPWETKPSVVAVAKPPASGPEPGSTWAKPMPPAPKRTISAEAFDRIKREAGL